MTDSAPTPLRILVLGSQNPPDVSDYLRGVLRDFAGSAIAALHTQGAEVRVIEASVPDASADSALSGMDGLLILGGADMDPACYGQRPEAETIYGLDIAADRFELAVMGHAQARGIPMLGICRGMQLMNVLQGGDLVQEIGTGTIHYSTADNSLMTEHEVTAAPGSRLAAIQGGQGLRVRSGHHQAVGRLGEGLTVTARAADGIIEAIEGAGDHWMLGIQWHPEDPAAPKADLNRLIAGFLDAVRQRRTA